MIKVCRFRKVKTYHYRNKRNKRKKETKRKIKIDKKKLTSEEKDKQFPQISECNSAGEGRNLILTFEGPGYPFNIADIKKSTEEMFL